VRQVSSRKRQELGGHSRPSDPREKNIYRGGQDAGRDTDEVDREWLDRQNSGR